MWLKSHEAFWPRGVVTEGLAIWPLRQGARAAPAFPRVELSALLSRSRNLNSSADSDLFSFSLFYSIPIKYPSDEPSLPANLPRT
jgi:hypothetical protein